MALSQATALLEKAIGHGDNAATKQDISNPAIDRQKYADPSGEKMKALVWNGKNSVKIGPWIPRALKSDWKRSKKNMLMDLRLQRRFPSRV